MGSFLVVSVGEHLINELAHVWDACYLHTRDSNENCSNYPRLLVHEVVQKNYGLEGNVYLGLRLIFLPNNWDAI